jgi:hypothetical protein
MISYEIIGRLIDRLTADAHNETGSVQAYALDLLADLGIPAPADPEMSPRYPKGTPEYAEYETELKSELDKWVRGEGEYARPDPFDAAIDVNAMRSARRVLGSTGLGDMPEEVFDQALRESVDPPRLPVKSAPVDLSGFGRSPFESSYNSRCRVADDYIDEGELIIKTPDGYAHWNCARDEYPDEITEIEKRGQ